MDDYDVELIISVALASGTYSLAGILGVSGPIAVVVAGLLLGNYGVDRAMSELTRLHLLTFWRLVEEVLNAFLFLDRFGRARNPQHHRHRPDGSHHSDGPLAERDGFDATAEPAGCA